MIAYLFGGPADGDTRLVGDNCTTVRAIIPPTLHAVGAWNPARIVKYRARLAGGRLVPYRDGFLFDFYAEEPLCP